MAAKQTFRHASAACTATALIVGLAACVAPPPAAPSRELPREGPQASWSIPSYDSGQSRVAVSGEIAVIPEKKAIRGVLPASGQQVWRIEKSERYTYRIAQDLIVVWENDEAQSTPATPFEVVDSKTGKNLWKSEKVETFSVYQDAIYIRACDALEPKPVGCRITKHAIRDGHALWTSAKDVSGIIEDSIGTRKPYAPSTSQYLPAFSIVNGPATIALETATGKIMRGRVPDAAWYSFTANNLVAVTDHDPPRNTSACAVTITTADITTGRTAWSGSDAVFSGRRKNGDCEKRLVSSSTDTILIGSGTKIVASTKENFPQVVDLSTGQSVWVGAEQGVPIDGDERSLLVRDYADEGKITVVDFASGKARWSAPDPGLSGQSASWKTAVTKKIVAVSGAVDNRPLVLVYDIESGRQLGRFPGWLAGAGDHWVTVTKTAEVGAVTLDFISFP